MLSKAALVLVLAVFGVNSYAPKPSPPGSYQAQRPAGSPSPWAFETTPTTTIRSPLWNDLRVTYSPQGQGSGFFRLPRTAREALAQGYTSPPEEQFATGQVGVMCPANDPSVCVLFDGVGNIAGMEIGVMKSDVLDKDYPFEQHPMFVSRQRFGYDTFITTLYFVDQTVLKRGGRPNIAAHGTGTGLWLKNGPGGKKLFEIPRFEKNLRRTLFKRQNCLAGMGRHYYYNMSPTLRCEDIEPIFGLYLNGELTGFGYKVFGQATPPANMAWFESIPIEALTQSIPDSPQCLIDRTDAVGLISLHVYFVDKPWDITCDERT